MPRRRRGARRSGEHGTRPQAGDREPRRARVGRRAGGGRRRDRGRRDGGRRGRPGLRRVGRSRCRRRGRRRRGGDVHELARPTAPARAWSPSASTVPVSPSAATPCRRGRSSPSTWPPETVAPSTACGSPVPPGRYSTTVTVNGVPAATLRRDAVEVEREDGGREVGAGERSTSMSSSSPSLQHVGADAGAEAVARAAVDPLRPVVRVRERVRLAEDRLREALRGPSCRASPPRARRPRCSAGSRPPTGRRRVGQRHDGARRAASRTAPPRAPSPSARRAPWPGGARAASRRARRTMLSFMRANPFPRGPSGVVVGGRSPGSRAYLSAPSRPALRTSGRDRRGGRPRGHPRSQWRVRAGFSPASLTTDPGSAGCYRGDEP